MRIGVEVPERIYKSGTHEVLEPFALGRQKTGRICVRFWIVNINRFMADIIISGNDHLGVINFQLGDILLKVIQKAVFEFLSQIAA